MRKEEMRSISHFQSGSEGIFYSAPPSPQRPNSVSTVASASTSSSSLSQTQFNNYFSTIPEEGNPQTVMQSDERADLREDMAPDTSPARTDHDGNGHMAANMSTSLGNITVHGRRHALRRRSQPIISGSPRPKLAIARRSSEKLDHSEHCERNIDSERQTGTCDRNSGDCCSSKAAFTSCSGSMSTHKFENESTFIAGPNPLRSLAMSRRLLASSSFTSPSFVSLKRDDGCSTHHNSDGNFEESNEKIQFRGIEDRQNATILLKSDLHDKKAVRLHTASSSLLASPTSFNLYDRLRRTWSAPATSDKYCHETDSCNAYVGNSAQASAEKTDIRQSPYNMVKRCIALSEAAKDDNNNDDGEDCGDNEDDIESITFLRSWRTSCSGDRHGFHPEIGKRTACAIERFLPPLKIWMIGDINKLGDRGHSTNDQNVPEAANQRTAKGNQAGPAITHTDVHVVALLPIESPGIESSGNLPRLTTAQLIETNESTYEVIWQENVRNSVTEVNERQSVVEIPVSRAHSPFREEHGLDKVTRKLESWFWQNWTRDGTSNEKVQDNERPDKLSMYNGMTSQCLSPPSTAAKSTKRADVRPGDDTARALAVPPNSAQSSQRSSRNPSLGYADDCEVTTTTGDRRHCSKLYRLQDSKQESIAAPMTSFFHAQPCFSSSPLSPLPLHSDYLIPPASSINHESITKETKSMATPEARDSSTAVRRLSNLTMSELTFRKHKDSLLLTRQRLLPAGGGIGASVSSAWPLQDSLVLNQKRLLRARKAQSNRVLRATERMTLGSPTSAPIDTPGSRPQPAVYRLSALSGLSPILDVSPPAEHNRTGMMTCDVDNRKCDILTTSTAATADKHGLRSASLAAFDGVGRFNKAQNIADDKQHSAGLAADSDNGGINNEVATTTNIEMPILVR